MPLCEQALDVLGEAAETYGNDGLLFPSPRGKALSDATVGKLLRENGVDAVPHGFRSSFRDWAAEHGYDHDVAESALAHTVRNAVEAAYRRTTFLAKRREMMAAWGEHCLPSGAHKAAGKPVGQRQRVENLVDKINARRALGNVSV